MDKANTIVLYTTGGTISSVYDADSGTIIPELTGEQLIEHIRPVLGDIDVELNDMEIRPGPHMTPKFVLELSKLIVEQLKRPEVSGAVVTQGTDSVDEVSYLMNLLVKSEKPVVITGAMKSENELYNDAIGNLTGAIRIANDKKSMNKGVLVYFDETIQSAHDVEKYHANRVDAFVSPKGPLGGVYHGEIIYNREPIEEPVYEPENLDQKVGLIKVCIGMDDLPVRVYMDNGYDGIVIEGFGAGNVPPTIADAVVEAMKMGIIIILVSRCFDGEAIQVYDYKGGGAQLGRAGVISGGYLSGQKARLKLMVLLGSGLSRSEIRESFM
jgi:L-asparaginase/archaeal Glu-tRNAGln amidotransferase subunit D